MKIGLSFCSFFATGEDPLPEMLEGQKDLLLSLYADDKWECRHILDELKGTQELYFDRVSQVRMPSWSLRPGRPPGRRRLLRFLTGRARSCPCYDCRLCTCGRTC